jgi:hypothetical protein
MRGLGTLLVGLLRPGRTAPPAPARRQPAVQGPVPTQIAPAAAPAGPPATGREQESDAASPRT